MNRKNLNGVTAFLLGSGLWTTTGLGVAAEKVCVPSPVHPCPAIPATSVRKDKVKPVLSPAPAVPIKQFVPLRTVQVWIPKTIQVPSFIGEGYRFQPRTVNVQAFSGEGYRSQPAKVTGPAAIERGFRKQ